MDCLFCKIVSGEIPSTKVYEDDICFAFRDIAPQGPVHVLVIPKEHIQSVNQVDDSNKDIVAHIFTVIPQIAKAEGIADEGYRVVSNIGERAEQTVPHLHFHIIGGRDMTWPPG
ncbi:MAG: histidine triad nucleotide-binding protein [Oscillospiraceae bacterium]|nr:histidine triad nucleotide-binding protein [Candidatus Limimonas egerieequi]